MERKQSVYRQIEQDIIEAIASKNLKPNDQIMTEEKLCKKYGVSRTTINRALSNLVNAGYIYRVPGKGSFVRVPKGATKFNTSSGFSEDMVSLGLKPGAKLLEYLVKRGREVPEAARKLQLGEDDLIHYFVRLRTGNDLPMALSYTYISGKCVPAIDLSCLEKSFYDYIDNTLGLVRSYLDGEMTACMPTPEQAELLAIENEALLYNTHVSYLDTGQPFEYIHTYYVGSRYSYYYTDWTERC